jgi:hypothetical protein
VFCFCNELDLFEATCLIIQGPPLQLFIFFVTYE